MEVEAQLRESIAPELLGRVCYRLFRVPGSQPGSSGLGTVTARTVAQR